MEKNVVLAGIFPRHNPIIVPDYTMLQRRPLGLAKPEDDPAVPRIILSPVDLDVLADYFPRSPFRKI